MEAIGSDERHEFCLQDVPIRLRVICATNHRAEASAATERDRLHPRSRDQRVKRLPRVAVKGPGAHLHRNRGVDLHRKPAGYLPRGGRDRQVLSQGTQIGVACEGPLERGVQIDRDFGRPGSHGQHRRFGGKQRPGRLGFGLRESRKEHRHQEGQTTGLSSERIPAGPVELPRPPVEMARGNHFPSIDQDLGPGHQILDFLARNQRNGHESYIRQDRRNRHRFLSFPEALPGTLSLGVGSTGLFRCGARGGLQDLHRAVFGQAVTSLGNHPITRR